VAIALSSIQRIWRYTQKPIHNSIKCGGAGNNDPVAISSLSLNSIYLLNSLTRFVYAREFRLAAEHY
jgi:hypothetical protein